MAELELVRQDTKKPRADCLRLLSHDLNNPLTAIRILAEMLRDEITDPEMRQDVTDILEAADVASALMDGMASMARYDDEEEEFTWFPVDMVELVRGVVDRPALRHRVTLRLPRVLETGGDRAGLQRALSDVLINGLRLLEQEEQLELTLGARADGGIELRVRHPAPAVPKELRHRLLERYGAVELRQHRVPVAAVGLVYARTVVEAHGGVIELLDAPDGGMDALIRLPH